MEYLKEDLNSPHLTLTITNSLITHPYVVYSTSTIIMKKNIKGTKTVKQMKGKTTRQIQKTH